MFLTNLDFILFLTHGQQVLVDLLFKSQRPPLKDI